ncbi:hypothetical protein GYMLUDRAFT_63323 [Collybiopsis luxurians FD-317 M1]|uniref:Caleosin-domain-containing protein n=1 Tax=Collybiopsis luxurians FD-317 M1 TaxID=944289 RepID=A0A0D0BWQ0_9AGAR|nr:hypothetical protein GYMLUDRAFT_63323 [Collybiopsis luxurians FD-317 M1]
MSDSQSNAWQSNDTDESKYANDSNDHPAGGGYQANPSDDSYAAAAARGATVDPGETKPRKKKTGAKGHKNHGYASKSNDSEENEDKDKEQAMIGHGEFFDADGDGVVWPTDTLRGFLALGYSFPLSIFATMVICTMSYASLPPPPPTKLIQIKFPDPFFRIYVDGLHKAKHGSDTGSFKRDGKFDEEQFDNFWNSHTDVPHDEITPAQLYRSVSERRLAFDFYGTFAAIFEWVATWLLFGYPTFHFNARLAMQKLKEFILAQTNGNREGKQVEDDQKGEDRAKKGQEEESAHSKSLTEAVALKLRKAENDLTVALKMACSGGNIKKDDVKGIYDGTIFYTTMKREAKAGNRWAQDLKKKHERLGQGRQVAATA